MPHSSPARSVHATPPSEALTRARVGREHGIDLVWLDQKSVDRSEGSQRRGAAAGAEHGQLTNDVTGSCYPYLLTVYEHGGLAADKHKTVRLRVALVAEIIAGREMPIDEQLSDVVDLAWGTTPEEIDLTDEGTPLGGVELCHAVTFGSGQPGG